MYYLFSADTNVQSATPEVGDTVASCEDISGVDKSPSTQPFQGFAGWTVP